MSKITVKSKKHTLAVQSSGTRMSSLLDDANLGGSQNAVPDFPASLHDDSDMIIIELALRCGHSEDGFMQLGVEFIANGVVLF